MTMYGCSIDQRLMLPRRRRTSSGTAGSGRNAVALDDIAGSRLPLVHLVGRHAGHAGERPRAQGPEPCAHYSDAERLPDNLRDRHESPHKTPLGPGTRERNASFPATAI